MLRNVLRFGYGSFQELTDSGVAVTEKSSMMEFHTVVGDHTWIYFREMGRGDLNADGIEDILVFQGFGSEGGTFQAYGLFGLTRKGPDAKFEVVAYDEGR